jgi:glycosyltransferase involved in cell wall biosynthesis
MIKNYIKFSIIVPVYNIDKYIGECLLSIMKQTLSENWECVVINDGSTDESLQIINNIINEDDRFKLITQQNRGLSSAKNLGIKKSIGEYLVFIDGDDLINKNYLLSILDSIRQTKSEVVIPKVIQSINKPDFSKIKATSMPNSFIDDYAKEKMADPINFGSSWSFICKRSLYENLIFPDTIFEDSFLLPKLIERVNKLSTSSDSFYWYRIRPGSIMSSNKNEQWYILKSKSHLYILKSLLNLNIMTSYSSRYMQFLHTYIEMSRLNFGENEILKFINLSVPKHYNGNYNFKFILIKNLGPKLFFKIINLLIKFKL